ncbi:MAG: carbamoyltransferase [Verrucomicrobiaceae bacterium]|nr:carbamoyltransferase [Verrucomicrobiaceae bacterium]
MNILGISAFYHDSAAALLRDGEIVAAAQEERFTRKKHDHGFPKKAVEACLKVGGITVDQIDSVVFYEKPFTKFARILDTHLAFVPKGLQAFMMAIPTWITEKLWIPGMVEDALGASRPLLFADHHESHAASAFFPSPFDRAAVLTIDGVGEWATSSYGVGDGNKLNVMKEMHFPHSLGLLYSAITYFTGFKVNSGEYKVMGLAPYGEPKYVKQIRDHLVDIREDGSFSMNQEYFNYCAGLTMTSPKMDELFGRPPRQAESRLGQEEMDLARSVQEVVEEIVMKMAAHVRKETGERYLCLAGGVALNCVANGKLLRSGIFDDIWIQPSAGDAGGALGAAYIGWHHYHEKPAKPKNGKDQMKGSYLGNAYSDDEVAAFLKEHNLPAVKLSTEELTARTAQVLSEGNVVGWFNGRMEFGPRALGGRSILGDPRSPEMQKKMNLKIKFRESFRPFAPSVLAEKVGDWFELDRASPYMLIVAPVKENIRRSMSAEEEALWGIEKLNVPRSSIPAVTHVDYSARVQTVTEEVNPVYYKLLQEFDKLTGCPVLVNTSFNVRGEPIVESPMDAYRCFMRTEMDNLVLGSYLLTKTEQPVFHDNINWQSTYELD